MARVLIVDDSSVARKLIKKILIAANHEIVAEADNGTDAFLKYKQTNPDIVTMDMDMPGISGLEASKMIFDYSPNANIIIITAHEQNDLAELLSESIIKDYIIKPVNDIVFNETVNKVLSMKISENPKQKKEPVENLQLRAGDLVVLSHYAYGDNIICLVKENKNNIYEIKMPNDITQFVFLKGDPLVAGFQDYNVYNLYGCTVLEINNNEKIIKVSADMTWKSTSLKNLFVKLPMSAKANIITENTDESSFLLIRNMNINNIEAYSEYDFSPNSRIKLELILNGNNKICLEVKVKQKNNFDYNLEIIYHDSSTENTIRNYINTLKEKNIEAINNLLNGM